MQICIPQHPFPTSLNNQIMEARILLLLKSTFPSLTDWRNFKFSVISDNFPDERAKFKSFAFNLISEKFISFHLIRRTIKVKSIFSSFTDASELLDKIADAGNEQVVSVGNFDKSVLQISDWLGWEQNMIKIQSVSVDEVDAIHAAIEKQEVTTARHTEY